MGQAPAQLAGLMGISCRAGAFAQSSRVLLNDRQPTPMPLAGPFANIATGNSSIVASLHLRLLACWSRQPSQLQRVHPPVQREEQMGVRVLHNAC